jgi:hypothetical protein
MFLVRVMGVCVGRYAEKARGVVWVKRKDRPGRNNLNGDTNNGIVCACTYGSFDIYAGAILNAPNAFADSFVVHLAKYFPKVESCLEYPASRTPNKEAASYTLILQGLIGECWAPGLSLRWLHCLLDAF